MWDILHGVKYGTISNVEVESFLFTANRRYPVKLLGLDNQVNSRIAAVCS
jgi:hypothetical protein